MRRVLARVVRPGQEEDAAQGRLEARLVACVDRLVGEGESSGTRRDGVDEVVSPSRDQAQPGHLGGLHLVAKVPDDHRAQLAPGEEQSRR